MAFPPTAVSNDGDAGNTIKAALAASGISVRGLTELGVLQLAVANLLSGQLPATSFSGALTLLAGALDTSPTLGIGYGTGAGGSVTQSTNRATPVTLNTVVGTIVGNGATLAASTSASFTVVNTVVAATDVVLLAVQSGPTPNTTVFSVARVAAGSFVIRAANVATATEDVAAPTLNFAILKGVAS
jgi:hypothetical protein